jgi:hypothetical protein
VTPQFAAEPQDFGPTVPFWRGRDLVTWALAVSLALHVVAGIAVLLQRQAAIAPAEQESLPVDFVTPEEYEAETRPEASAPAAQPARPSESGAGGMIRPTAMLSAAALADPKAAEGRAVLKQLAGDEREVQICNLEAIEQVKAWKPSFQPERIIAYASAEVSVTRSAVKAGGAAFFSDGQWYRLRYDCGLAGETVVSFAFEVGDTIPPDQWDAHHLPTAN